jgi:CMP-N,N'-diacetyllegionaminic acid synthase
MSIPILILARGGSKRLPNKNLFKINNKPLVQYAIEASLKFTNDVYVSSDSDKILNISIKSGAKTIERPSEFAQDNTTSEAAAKHFLEEINYDGDFILVQPTSPLIKSIYIKEGYNLYIENGYDSVFSVCNASGIYYSEKNGKINKLNLKSKNIKKENGAFYITHSKKILKGKKFINGKCGWIEMPLKYSVDIDHYEDLDLARIIITNNT